MVIVTGSKSHVEQIWLAPTQTAGLAACGRGRALLLRNSARRILPVVAWSTKETLKRRGASVESGREPGRGFRSLAAEREGADGRESGDQHNGLIRRQLHHLARGKQRPGGFLTADDDMAKPRREPMTCIVALGAQFGCGA